MSNRQVVTTVVSKAAIDMGSAQTLQQFTANMTKAGKDYHTGAEWLWLEELAPATVIFCVEGEDYEFKYWQHNWAISDGLPQLQANPIEMQRVSSFVPKPTV